MKIRISKPAEWNGSILMMTLFTAAFIGTALASYLMLVRREDAAVSRSQGWNASLTLAEAGVEEALAQLNSGAASFSGDLSANGWGPPAAGRFILHSRPLSGGRYDVKYFTNGNSSPTPTIISTGYVTIPALSATLSRQIRVTTKSVPLLNMALATKYGITVNGNGISADSFNSADPAHGGGTNGDVASLYGPINLGNPNIRGDLFLGPTATGGGGINGSQVSGGIHTDFNVEYPDVAAPPDAPSWPPAPFDGTGTKHDFQNGCNNRGFEISDSRPIIVRSGVNVKLYVTTTAFAPSRIEIQTNNLASGSVTFYQVAGSATFPRNGNTLVEGGLPANFQYFGLPGVTNVTYEGDSDFTGVIYAPAANLTVNNGYTYRWYGACIARSITINGQRFNFRFDENLLKAGPIRGFMAKSWEEL